MFETWRIGRICGRGIYEVLRPQLGTTEGRLLRVVEELLQTVGQAYEAMSN